MRSRLSEQTVCCARYSCTNSQNWVTFSRGVCFFFGWNEEKEVKQDNFLKMKPRVVLFACIGLMIFHQITALLWMQFTLMQVVIAVSWPIPFPHPDRKIFFNIGFQFNYAEPFRPSSFYQPTYWPLGRSATEGDSADNGTTAESQSGGEKSARSLSVEDQHPELRGRDLTAGELYKSIEGNLEV